MAKKKPKEKEYKGYHSSMKVEVDIPSGLTKTWDRPENTEQYLKQLRKEEARLSEVYEGLRTTVDKPRKLQLKILNYFTRLQSIREEIAILSENHD